MARSVNQVTLMGRLTRDVDLRTTPSGKQVASFSIAVDKPGKQEGAYFFECTAWEGLAENISKYIGKGSKVLVLGYLEQQSFEKDGQKRQAVKVVANDVSFLDSKTEGVTNQTQDTVTDVDDNPINLDDIPF